MDHDLEWILPRLEILEIEVCNILQNPGNIGKHFFVDSVLSWKYWETDVFEFLISWKYWKSDFLISHILEILDRTIHTQSYPGNSGSYDPYLLLC